jgi:hypothetical protein
MRRCAPIILALALLSGCDLFDTREPEQPDGGAGTWLQPDTPDRVVRNIQNAVAEMNVQNYLRSLGPGFVFEPAVSARAREPSLWSGWAISEEETYFGRLAASSNFLSGHSLQLLDITENVVSDERFVLDANYILTVQHSRSADPENVPTDFQGHLVWAIQRSSEGLWYLQSWTDQESANQASWSELKSTFVK